MPWRGGTFDVSTDLVAESTGADAVYIDPDAVEQRDGLWRVHAGVYDQNLKTVTGYVAFFGDPADGCKPWDEAWPDGAQAAARSPSRAELLRRLPPGTLTLGEIRRATGYEAHEVFGTVILGSRAGRGVAPRRGS